MAIDEPRAQLQSVKSVLSPDFNSVQVTVNFQVVSTQEPVELNITLARLR